MSADGFHQAQDSPPASNRDLAADLDDAVRGQPEVIRGMRGVALHEGEKRLQPARLRPAVLARDDGLVAEVISRVLEVDLAAALAGELQQCRDVGPFHEAVVRGRAPEVWGHFFDGKAIGVPDPRYGLR